MRAWIALTAALAVVAATGADARKPRGPRPFANPSALIAAEFAFAQLAQAKGQWSAFVATSTDDAVMFAPQPVNVHQFLKGKPNPPVAVKWQAQRVWSSCDGSFGVTTGAWQLPKATGYFSTVWHRQKDGGYKWVMDGGDTLATPFAVPEFIEAKVASCEHRAAVPAAGPADDDTRAGESDDRTLRWSAQVDARGGRVFRVSTWNGTGFDEVLDQTIAPPAG
jgi:hypothetical protein